MKSFLFGLVLGLLVAFPAGINIGKGQPLISNPFTEGPLVSEQVRDTASEAIEQAGEAVDNATE